MRDRIDKESRAAERRRIVTRAGRDGSDRALPELIAETLDGGGTNSHCAGAETRPPASAENQRTLGALFSFGGFSFLNLGDLDWDMEMKLSCEGHWPKASVQPTARSR